MVTNYLVYFITVLVGMIIGRLIYGYFARKKVNK